MKGFVRSSAVLAILVAMAQGQAWASGFNIDTHDARGTGRSYAAAAGTDDAGALFYNPAAIGQSEIFDKFLTTKLSLHYINANADYDPLAGEGFDANMETGQFFIPASFMVMNVSDVVDLGVSVHTPFALETNWERNWTGRYLALKNAVGWTFINPVLTITPFKGFSIAVGPQFNFVPADVPGGTEIRLNRALDFRFLGETDGELLVRGHSKHLNVGWQAAFHWTLPVWDERIKVGFVYRGTPDGHKLEGEAQFRNAPAATGLPANTDVRTTIRLPQSVWWGVEFELIEDFFWLEFNHKWVDWSILTKISLNFENPAAPDSDLEFQWRDTHMFMIGAELQPVEGVRLRAGWFYDQSPVTRAHLSPVLPDADRNGVSIGVGFDLGPAKIDLAYQHLFFDTARKDNTEGLDSPGGPATANGSYNTSVDLVGVSIEFGF